MSRRCSSGVVVQKSCSLQSWAVDAVRESRWLWIWRNPFNAMRVENTVHPLEVKAGHVEVRAPIVATKIAKKIIPLSIVSVRQPEVSYVPPHPPTPPQLLPGQATEYLAPSPQSGSSEPDNVTAAHRPPQP